MTDSKDMGKKQLGPLDEEQLISSHARYSTKDFSFQPNSGFSSFAGHLGLSHIPLALQVFFLIVFSVLLVVVLAKVFSIPSSQGQEQSSQEKVYQELTQLKAGVDRLCRPCPWDWTPFQGSCYFFSVVQKAWNDSATACQKVGAQLVVIKSDEEQNFLQQSSKKRGNTWMGLIDMNKESTWHWVDGSPLTLRAGWMPLTNMDTGGYSKLGSAIEEVPQASNERRALLSHQDLLKTNVTQGLAKAGRDREDIRNELLRALEAVKQQNRSCEQCPTSWLFFQGSCYYFSETQAVWDTAQSYCSAHGAYLVIVKGPEEQGFLSQHTRGRGYWLGLKAVRRLGKIQGYQWVDGVSLTFSNWNSGEPNDSRGQEDCVMMLHSGLWNDAPCTNERDGWICEKRSIC
ncbi:C-type lectin domain family 4 member G [Cricetulus griseus]|uniref:C-type lectin domain family 4 member G n=1 Tax=Cricetulus griseus TaxID=10029 RepID=G3HWX1_CRIGR|nr:C-type lectin domain family 4 member G [Cricetulus griseus]